MELELSLSPPNQKRQSINKSCHNNNNNNNNHPRLNVSKFPLLSWDHNEDDEQPNSVFTGDNYHPDLDDDAEGLTGWPPLHSWRRRLMMEENQHEGENIDYVMNNNYNNELFVKVKMDGVGIARKIDLNAFDSYQTLTTALIHMFDKSVEIEEDGASYQLMYQHRDGHWHLGGDLPWEMFIRSVKRIQMVRN